MSCKQFKGISRRCTYRSTEVGDLITFLNAFLSSVSSPVLPPSLLADIHSCIGMLKAKTSRRDSAVRHLMTALWIQKRAKVETIDIAVTKHRLALAYIGNQDYSSAANLLEEAFADYGRAQMKLDHPCRADAQRSLRHIRPKKPLLLSSESHHSMSVYIKATAIDDDLSSTSLSSETPFDSLSDRS
jgi:hypothetical protein